MAGGNRESSGIFGNLPPLSTPNMQPQLKRQQKERHERYHQAHVVLQIPPQDQQHPTAAFTMRSSSPDAMAHTASSASASRIGSFMVVWFISLSVQTCPVYRLPASPFFDRYQFVSVVNAENLVGDIRRPIAAVANVTQAGKHPHRFIAAADLENAFHLVNSLWLRSLDLLKARFPQCIPNGLAALALLHVGEKYLSKFDHP
jgi:hypothetical protein